MSLRARCFHQAAMQLSMRFGICCCEGLLGRRSCSAKQVVKIYKGFESRRTSNAEDLVTTAVACSRHARNGLEIKMTLSNITPFSLASFLLAVTVASSTAETARADVTAPAIAESARASGPHLFVGEEYDVSGTMMRAVSFPIVNGLVQPNYDKIYHQAYATLTTKPGGMLLSGFLTGLETLSPESGQVGDTLNFHPVNQNLFPSVTELHVDGTGRIYGSFSYQSRNVFYAGLAIYPAGATGNQAPYAVLKIPSSGASPEGIATRADTLYVSNPGRGEIDIFAPLAQPRHIGQITGLKDPAGVSFDARGELYVCNAGDGTVLAFPPTQRGTVKPDRVISVKGHRLCKLPQGFFGNGNEMTVQGESLFVSADGGFTVFQLDATRGGPQTPLASVAIAQQQPWEAIDLSVGPR